MLSARLLALGLAWAVLSGAWDGPATAAAARETVAAGATVTGPPAAVAPPAADAQPEAVAPPAAAGEPSAAELMDALMWGHEPVGGPFELTDHTGARRTDADFRGKLLLVYFGYTYCPDVCPTDLQAMTAAVDRLGPAGEAVQPLFVTVDPERDTAEHLAHYVPLFHPRLIGLTGQPGEIRRVARAYKVYYAKVRESGGRDYAIDHTGFIYLVGADGRYLGFFPPGTPPERLVAVIRPHLPPASGR